MLESLLALAGIADSPGELLVTVRKLAALPASCMNGNIQSNVIRRRHSHRHRHRLGCPHRMLQEAKTHL